jgi:hypothetical protein
MTEPDLTDLPDGEYVTWMGRVYQGSVNGPGTVLLVSTSPEEGFEPTRTGRAFRRTVPRAEAEVWTLRTRCRWRDLPCSVLGVTDGRTSLRYLGDDGERARAAGMTEVDRGVFSATVPTAEVSELEQVRTTH